MTAGEGPQFASTDPATGLTVWQGRAASPAQVDRAVAAARAALPAWSDQSLQTRISILQSFAEQLRGHADGLASAISLETGKPLWESREEVAAMANKIPVSILAYQQRRQESQENQSGAVAATRYRPDGVVAVLGPFNLPGHLPNGHIVPALLAGNTVVFKPSELTPGVAQKTIELWQAAGVPSGVINLVQGGGEVGAALSRHPDLDGLFFTGSYSVGAALHRQFAGQVNKILALEMGGNNPLVVAPCADQTAAALAVIQSAYITAGQRCTCARRLILVNDAGADRFLDRLVDLIGKIRVGAFTENPEPFMGPIVSAAAAGKLLAAQADLLRRGGRSIVAMKNIGPTPAMLSPGLIDVSGTSDRPDAEYFGPILQLIRVPDLEAAIAEANRTRFGLAAGLLCDDPRAWERFYRHIRFGVINWNRPTTGASGKLPFGGAGLSGNHRPSGFWAADYCSWPVASLENPKLSLPASLPPGLSV